MFCKSRGCQWGNEYVLRGQMVVTQGRWKEGFPMDDVRRAQVSYGGHTTCTQVSFGRHTQVRMMLEDAQVFHKAGSTQATHPPLRETLPPSQEFPSLTHSCLHSSTSSPSSSPPRSSPFNHYIHHLGPLLNVINTFE